MLPQAFQGFAWKLLLLLIIWLNRRIKKAQAFIHVLA